MSASLFVSFPSGPGPRRFRAVPLSSLRVDTIARFEIHIRTQHQPDPVLYRARELPITAQTLLVLRDRGHKEVLVPADQEPEYQQYIEENLGSILSDESIPIEQRSQVLYESATNLMRYVFEAPRSPDMVKRSKDMVANASAFLQNEKVAFEHLLSLVSFDYYTYTHSVNVFVFSYMLAQYAGFTDPALLRDLGEGALLHDVGKSRLDSSIVQCAGPLTDAQWAEMRKHPTYGYEILRDHNAFGALALDIVLHHHEKLGGGGYPDGLSGDQIHPLVRISTIADIFDAMTTRRSYRDAIDSFPALRTMRDEMANALDPTLFRQFVEMMGNPRGIRVAAS
ncbi:MAG: HD domain-containing protein [Candidatus Hydrogenedentes bacterium]|nr:HD domain-containing protein [Candidatus Hydrogenedentota bacterium]